MRARTQHGFSLVELAVVMLVLTIVIASAITALRVQAERTRYAEARAQVDEAREALLNFAATHISLRLPCPDTNQDGRADSCSGTGVIRGTLPWLDLALPQRDPWGQPLRYAVHGKFAAATPTLSSLSGLCVVRSLSDGTYEALGNGTSVVLAVWSSGPDAADASAAASSTRVVAEGPASDDVVGWLSRFVLIGRMLEAGRDLDQGSDSASDNCP